MGDPFTVASSSVSSADAIPSYARTNLVAYRKLTPLPSSFIGSTTQNRTPLFLNQGGKGNFFRTVLFSYFVHGLVYPLIFIVLWPAFHLLKQR